MTMTDVSRTKNKTSMRFRILILVHVCAAFPLKCPEPAQWTFRARAHCPDPSKYFCLKNDLINGFSENCTLSDFLQPGRKGVLRGGLDADICSQERYHPWPIKYYTNVSTGCIFLKSACNEEGQVIYDNGDRNRDISCSCDYTRGYTFLLKPQNQCFCVPSEEDCSCYLKICKNSYNMSSTDNACIHVNMNKSTITCKPIIIERASKDGNQNSSVDMAGKENISSPVLWKICVVITVAVFFIGLTIVYCLIELWRLFYQKDPVNSLSIEEDNFIRYYLLYQELAPESLRIYCTRKIPQPILAANLDIPIRKTIVNRQKYEKEESSIPSPAENVKVKLTEFDFTLLYKLIRKTMFSPHEPTRGWGSEPLQEDITEEDYIERIRCCRQFLVDLTTFRLEECDFNKWWSYLSQAILQLSRNTLLTKIDELSERKLDQNFKAELFIKIKRNIDTMKVESKNEHSYETIVPEQAKIKKKEDDHNPPDIRDYMDNRIENWEKDDLLYIITRATHHVLDCIIKHKCVSVTGPSGIGKTALVRHVALQMKRKGYTLLEVTRAKEIKKFFKLNRKTLYIVDDMCGNFSANQSRLEKWKESMNDIKSILENHKNRLILTCRLQVFQDKGFRNLDIFKTCECNLRSNDLSLSYFEKENMTRKYFGEYALEALTHLDEYEFLPLLCKLYHVQTNNQQIDINMFLNDPFSFYEEDLRHMRDDCTEGKYKYCALLLLVIFNNKLEDKNIKGKDPKVKEIIEDIIEVCEIDEKITHATGRKLMSQLQILIGTFVTYDEGIYQMIHDKLFDFLAVHFGRQEEFVTILIKHAKDRFVRERFIVTEDNKSTQSLICIYNDKLELYLKRVFEDMINSSNVNTHIYENRNLWNIKFRTMFLNFMKNHNNYEIPVVIETASISFLNTMFVMSDKDSKEKKINLWDDESFCIILPDDMIQTYIARWFDALTKTSYTKGFLQQNRLLVNADFRSALRIFISGLKTETIASFIEHGTDDFINTLFFMKQDVIKDKAMTYYKWVGIVIPNNLLQNYIKKWFKCLSLCNNDFVYTNSIIQFIDDSRPMMHVTFRNALRNYINLLNKDEIASLIRTSTVEFINKMFVMTIGDTKNNNTNQYESLGIVIPADLLQQYIERLFDDLTTSGSVHNIIDENRPLMNVTFRTIFRKYMKQLHTYKISAIIRTAEDNFFNQMFVMTEQDIKDSADQQYECFGIVIPDDMLQQYIKRLFDDLTNISYSSDCVNNRPLMNDSFRSAVRNHMRLLKTETIASIIHTAGHYFFNTMFAMTEDDIRNNLDNGYECFGIVIPDDLLQQYIQKWFADLTKSRMVKIDIKNNKTLLNVTFRSAVRTHLKQLTTEQIATIIDSAEDNFFNKMFVKNEDDIIDSVENGYKCFGIVIPDDLLQTYIKKWFKNLITSSVKYVIGTNRPLHNVTFRSDVRNHMKQLTPELISSIIHTAGGDFLNRMFVMTEDDIKDNVEDGYECFGIVIPNDLLQHYIQKWLDKTSLGVTGAIDENRPLMNETFRSAVRYQMNQLTIEQIASIIHKAEEKFLNTMFVMTEDDIRDNDENGYESFGIVIPDDLLQQYIMRWLEYFIISRSVKNAIDENRPFMNIKFRTAFRTYLRQLHTDKISVIIRTAQIDFINLMFVMTEQDINDNADIQYDCFGIVIPDSLLPQYIERLFNNLTNNSYIYSYVDNRPLGNVIFRSAVRNHVRQLKTEKIALIIHTAMEVFFNEMFVNTENEIKENVENGYECFVIIIPDDLLQQYIEKWFYFFTKSKRVDANITENRPMRNVTFRRAVRNHMKQLTTEEIASIIRTAKHDFFNKVFVKTADDIKEDVANGYKCFGIVIPDDLLQQYIEKWFAKLIKFKRLSYVIDENRPLRNVTFRSAVRNHMKQLTTEQISSIIHTVDDEYFNKIFVKTAGDIKENVENGYECLGIVIPNDLLQQYIMKWFNYLTTSSSINYTINENRPLINASFRSDVRNFMKQLTTVQISSIILSASNDFINKMFVRTEDDLRDNFEKGYECFGIVIPVDLLQQYIAELFNCLIQTYSVMGMINENRLLTNVTFRTTFQSYLNQLHTDKISAIIRTAKNDFINRMFVMTEQNNKDNADEQYKSFSIVIPSDLLQQYIERLFVDFTKTYELEKIIDENRPLLNFTFRTAFRDYLRHLHTDNISEIIRTAPIGFINLMFVMSEDDINDNSKTRYEWFGIVIPDGLLPKYIERLFDDLSKTSKTSVTNRPLMNTLFRSAVRSYMRQLKTDKIASIIHTATDDFFNKMFVKTEDDIKDHIMNGYECFVIVIPDDLLQMYIEVWLKKLTKCNTSYYDINENRPLMNVTFRSAVRYYLKQLTTEQISAIIRSATFSLFHAMFVMTEDDIKDNFEDGYRDLGIVIPDDLLQQYIERWWKKLKRYINLDYIIDENRLMMNDRFRSAVRHHIKQLTTEKIDWIIHTAEEDFLNIMFVMTEDDIKENVEDGYECFGIVIPDDLLQQYIQRWLDNLTRSSSVKDVIDRNRPLLNVTFRSAVRTHMQQLTTEDIASIICTAEEDFINTMFVRTEDDISDNFENGYECFGIVIPDDLLQQYIVKWFEDLTKSRNVFDTINQNRPWIHDTFRSDVCSLMKEMTYEQISSIIHTAEEDFLNIMFVMTEDDIKDNVEDGYECFGIVIPNDLLQQYIKKWLDDLTKSSCVKDVLDQNRSWMNEKFRSAVRNYMTQLTNEQIASIIRSASEDFINTMFVRTENEIKDYFENRYECVGIVITEDLLHQYIKKWFSKLTETCCVKEFMDNCKPLKDLSYRTALRTYIKQQNEKVHLLIQTGKIDFLNTMFVMSNDDIKEMAEIRYKCFGIVLPEYMLQQYIESWFFGLSLRNDTECVMDENRLFMSITFCTSLQIFIRKLTTERIIHIIQTGSTDFINRMFVMTEEDIKHNSDNQYESFGIVISDDLVLLKQYIERWFYSVTEANSVVKCMNDNRPLMNITFRTALRTYMTRLDKGEIGNLIQTRGGDFLNTMCVLTEDDIMKDNSENRYETFGIVIPDNMLHLYIQKWLDDLTKTRWVEYSIDKNRLLMNFTFRSTVRTLMTRLTSENIAFLIQTGNPEFLNIMFVMTENDINDNTEYRYECIGIVIPNELFLIQQYIERWFDSVTKANSVKEFMNVNRPLRNVTFQNTLRTYMSQLLKEDIITLFKTGSSDFLNTMFVLTEDDIVSDNAEYRFECFGIVIPDDMLQEYTSRWIDCMKKVDSVIEFVRANRSSMSEILQSELESYINKIKAEKQSLD